MRRIVPVTIIALAATMLVAPSGIATWYAYGSYEPDNDLDVSGLMWENPPGLVKDRVYFNVISNFGNLNINPHAGANPNVGYLHTAIETPALESHYGTLGVWTDCNGDGYIGHFESGLREYRSDVLAQSAVGLSICPATTGSPNTWNGANNYNNNVVELIPIAGLDPDAGESSGSRDKRVWPDAAAKVWGDYGRPDDSLALAGASCAITPLPRGTWSSTGGVLDYADCHTNLLGFYNIAWRDQHVVAGNAVPGLGNPLGLRWPDDNDGRSHPLGQISTFGPEDSSQSAVHTWDCDSPAILHTGTFINNTNPGIGGATSGPLHTITVRNVDPSRGDGTSIPATYNETVEGGPFMISYDADGNLDSSSNCDYSDDAGRDFYGGLLLEGDATSGGGVTGKREAEWNFEFDYSNRGGFPVSLAGGSGNAGMNEEDFGLGGGGSAWYSPPSTLKAYTTVTTRGTIAGGDVSAEIDRPYWLSFYAYVGTQTTTTNQFKTPGGSGTYGFDQCGANRSDTLNGWDCNPTKWNYDANGQPLPTPPLNAKIGDSYNLRDVDCYDGNVRGHDPATFDIGVAPAFYGTPCPR